MIRGVGGVPGVTTGVAGGETQGLGISLVRRGTTLGGATCPSQREWPRAKIQYHGLALVSASSRLVHRGYLNRKACKEDPKALLTLGPAEAKPKLRTKT